MNGCHKQDQVSGELLSAPRQSRGSRSELGQSEPVCKQVAGDSCFQQRYGFLDECSSSRPCKEPAVLISRSGKRRYNVKVWKMFSDTFNCLPVAGMVSGRILGMHGGLVSALRAGNGTV